MGEGKEGFNQNQRDNALGAEGAEEETRTTQDEEAQATLLADIQVMVGLYDGARRRRGAISLYCYCSRAWRRHSYPVEPSQTSPPQHRPLRESLGERSGDDTAAR